MSKSNSTLALVAVVAAAAFLAAVAATTSARAQPDAKSKAGPQRGVAALGRLEPPGGIVRVAAPSTPDAVSGAVVVKLHVERGADVKAGDLLAELDTAGIAKARVVEAQADLEIARRDVLAAASVAEEACVLADVAARQSRRKTELQGRGLASTEETESAKGNSEAGAASCRARTTEARVADSRVAAAQARLTRSQAELERSYVRAPFGGRVLDLLVMPGELAGQDGILELGRVDRMQAVAEVYESDIRFVKTGQKARLKSEALAQDLHGTVARIRPKVQKLDHIGDDPAARKDARIVEVEIHLDDPRPAANLTNLQVEIEIGR
ncbi:MAG: HlyD family efflux transporter periplasmic adaptor subunit [Steroidobacteraceae bacterium]